MLAIEDRRWQAGKTCPPGALGSEPESEPGGRLRRVRPTVGVEGLDAKIGVFVNVASVLGAQRNVSGQRVVGAYAIQESAFRLGIGAGHEATRVARWMK